MTTRNDNTLETPITLVKWPWFCSEGEDQGPILLVLFARPLPLFFLHFFFLPPMVFWNFSLMINDHDEWSHALYPILGIQSHGWDYQQDQPLTNYFDFWEHVCYQGVSQQDCATVGFELCAKCRLGGCVFSAVPTPRVLPLPVSVSGNALFVDDMAALVYSFQFGFDCIACERIQKVYMHDDKMRDDDEGGAGTLAEATRFLDLQYVFFCSAYFWRLGAMDQDCALFAFCSLKNALPCLVEEGLKELKARRELGSSD